MPPRMKNNPPRDISKLIDKVRNSDTSIGPGPDLGTEIYDRVDRAANVHPDGFASKLPRGPRTDG